MAVALVDQTTAASNPAFVARVLAALALTAQQIGTEGSTVTNHQNRSTLATRVSNSPDSYSRAFALMLAAQSIDNSATDAQILSMISAVWNTEAGGL